MQAPAALRERELDGVAAARCAPASGAPTRRAGEGEPAASRDGRRDLRRQDLLLGRGRPAPRARAGPRRDARGRRSAAWVDLDDAGRVEVDRAWFRGDGHALVGQPPRRLPRRAGARRPRRAGRADRAAVVRARRGPHRRDLGRRRRRARPTTRWPRSPRGRDDATWRRSPPGGSRPGAAASGCGWPTRPRARRRRRRATPPPRRAPPPQLRAARRRRARRAILDEAERALRLAARRDRRAARPRRPRPARSSCSSTAWTRSSRARRRARRWERGAALSASRRATGPTPIRGTR